LRCDSGKSRTVPACLLKKVPPISGTFFYILYT